jgi:hypothetical protein
MSTGNKEYRHNHYVPKWYQQAFMLPGQSRHHYLDLAPEVIEENGQRWTRKDSHLGGPPCLSSFPKQNQSDAPLWGASDRNA